MAAKFKIIIILLLMSFFSGNCGSQSDSSEERWARQRESMVENQISRRGIKDKNVLAAMRTVPRHLFVPENYRSEAYTDGPLPIGYDQTISQPYIVAIMTELLKPDSTSKILEIGTGSGYQAAVLAEIVESVYTIEIVTKLAERAEKILDSIGYKNIAVRAGDGYLGWPEAAPFDGVIVTAAAPHIPAPLIEQLKIGGRIVIPVGDYGQDLMVATKDDTGLVRESVIPVRFVPMTGKIRE
jgi:protein-L-isoaspartate(D-aspartate) O-methyltransferase